LSIFPMLDTSNATDFGSAWSGCSGLTAFPPLQTGRGGDFSGTWELCFGLTSFPVLDTSNGIAFYATWYGCFGLTSFPALDTSNGTDFQQAWAGCSGLTAFPPLNLGRMTNGINCFQGDTLSTASYSGLLVSIATLNANAAVTFDGGNSQYSAGAATYARNTTLTAALGWTITDGGPALAPQTITFAAVANQAYDAPPLILNATASSGLPVTLRVVSGPASVSGMDLTMTGTGTVVVAADQAGDASYLAAPEVQISFVVVPVGQKIAFTTIAPQTYGVAPIALSATATSGLPVAITVQSGPATINGTMLTITGAGVVVLAANQAGNQDYLAATTETQSITVAQEAQTITFAAIPAQAFSSTPLTLTATASSGLGVTYTVTSGPATVSGSLLTVTGVGTVAVTAHQGGNGNYLAALPVTQSFTIAKGAQTITFAAVGNLTYPTVSVTLSASASSGLPVAITVKSGPATISGATLTLTGTGTVVLDANQSGNTDYLAAPQATQSIVIKKAQVITFAAVGSVTYGTAPVTLSATASSGLAPVFSIVSGPATVSGTKLTITGAGTVQVAANQVGNGTYWAAPQVIQTITVSQEAQTIAFTLANQTYGVAPLTLNGTATSALAVTYSVTGPATLSGSKLTITGGGTVTVTASQAGNANYLPAPAVVQTITVAPKAQTITFPTIANKTYGVAPLNLSATASSGLAPVFTVLSGPANLNGTLTTLTITGTGTVTVIANQPGNASYLPAAAVSQSFTVAQEAQTINFIAPANEIYGVGPLTLSATATSGLAPTFSIQSGPATLTGSVLTITAAGSVVVVAKQAGNANFLAAPPVPQTITVAKAAQTITFAAVLPQVWGVPPLTLSATATSGLPVAFTVVSGPATISGATLTITGAGTVVVDAKQAGNADYLAATTVSQTITVTATDAIAINAGGPAVANFVADKDYTGTTTVYDTTATVATAGVAHAAPESVYQSERSGQTFTYTIPGLVAGGAYTVRLHFAEIVLTSPGQRVFNVAINGTTELPHFDIVATAGGPNIAVVQSLSASPNASGQIVITFTTVTNAAVVSGLEIITLANSN
jgi:hypothetical protein